MKEPEEFIIDCTGLTNCHSNRGLGRYVNGLLSGFLELKRENIINQEIAVFAGSKIDDDIIYKQYIYKQFSTNAEKLYWENLLLGSRKLKDSRAKIFHSTTMDGVVRNIPWVATCHDLIPLCYPKDYLPFSSVLGWVFWKRYLYELKNNVHQIICDSEDVKNVLINKFGVERDKLSVVNLGLSPFWFSKPETNKISDKVKELNNRDFFLFVGGFDPRKNFDRLANALVNIKKFDDFQLVVVGHRSKKIKKRHSELLKNLKVQPLFLEYVNDHEMLYLYGNCRALLFPSYCEGWGFPIVEAMASGNRVLCSNTGSMKESSAGLGHYVDVMDLEGLAAGVEYLIDNEDIEAEKEKRIEAMKSFSWRNCALETVKVYEKVFESA